MRAEAKIGSVRSRAFTIPTDAPEADGTMSWTSTTLVLVEVEAAGRQGIGYTYTDRSAVPLITGMLAKSLADSDAMDPPGCSAAMHRAVRNVGREGIAATAISAVDAALWDLKAKVLDLPLIRLLGACRDHVPIYGSGGFTSYDDRQLTQQLAVWAEGDGCRWVKMKVGTQAADDPRRVRVAKQAIGDDAQLFVDANGAYAVKEAIALAQTFKSEADIGWFEEPVSSDDLDGLQQVRAACPAGLDVAAGEYGYTIDYFRRMLAARAIDVQQADASRCGGVTGFLRAGTLADAHHIDLSGHCAPALHVHVACAVPRLRHLEWFHDHVRIEHMLFDGAPTPRKGAIRPDLARPGLGLDFRWQDAERFAV